VLPIDLRANSPPVVLIRSMNVVGHQHAGVNGATVFRRLRPAVNRL
jgi:hypothetical protein